MTLCGRRRCWDIDAGRPGGWMNSCGRYWRDWTSRGGLVEVHNNKQQILRLDKSLTEACNPNTL